jgi:hypothetical protein
MHAFGPHYEQNEGQLNELEYFTLTDDQTHRFRKCFVWAISGSAQRLSAEHCHESCGRLGSGQS